MDMSDPLTADFPTRNTDQDEEMAASSDTNLAYQRPAIYWDSVTSSSFVDGKLHIKQLVIATSPASCQLLRHCCPTQQAAGVIMLPGQAQGPGITLPSPADKVCFMYLMNDSTVQAQHVLVLASLPAFSYRGPGNPSEEALHYVVQTAAAKQQSKDKHHIPSLPSGSLITGLAAAAIQHAEVRRQGATALIGSQWS
ncbi:hypothetical protein WJX82_009653 [Trebouxia sp. C0006]